MQQLLWDKRFARANALPTAQIRMHVSTRPRQRQLVSRQGDVAQLQACTSGREKVRPIGDAVACVIGIGSVLRRIAKVDVGDIPVERDVLARRGPPQRSLYT